MLNNKNTILLIIILVFVLVCAIIITHSYTQIPVLSLLPVLVFILIAVLWQLKYFTRNKIKGIFFILLIIKYSVLCYQSINRDIPMGGVDWINFNRSALEILDANNSIASILSSDFNLFPKLVAIIYYLFGNDITLIYFYVFGISIITQIYIYKTTLLLTNNSYSSQKIALLWMIWPIEFIFSITFLREIPTQCLFIMSVYHFTLFLKQNRFRNLLIALLLSILATLMHSGMIAIMFVYLFIWATKGEQISNILKIGLGVVLIVTLLASPLGELMITKFKNIDSIEDVIAVQTVRGNTNYVSTVPTSTLGLFLQLPYRIIMFAISPLPWQIFSMETLIAWLVDGILQLFMWYKIFQYSFKYKPASRFARTFKRTFLFVIFSTYMLFALGTNNYGTAMRHRVKLFPMIILLLPILSQGNTNTMYIKIKKKT